MAENEPTELDQAPKPPHMTGYAILFMAFLLLAVLKLLAFLEWSWLWITIPLWIVPAAYLVTIVIAVVAAFVRVLKRQFKRS